MIKVMVVEQSANAILIKAPVVRVDLHAVFGRGTPEGSNRSRTPDFLRIVAAENERIGDRSGQGTSRSCRFMEFLRSQVVFENDAIRALADVIVEVRVLIEEWEMGRYNEEKYFYFQHAATYSVMVVVVVVRLQIPQSC